MSEIIVVARKGSPVRMVYLNHCLVRLERRLEYVTPFVKKLEAALGVKSKQITVRGKPKEGETVEAAFYRLAKMYLGYRANCIEKRKVAKNGVSPLDDMLNHVAFA